MARNRQRAKQRQQARRERLRQEGQPDVEPTEEEESADLEASAPPKDVGFSEAVVPDSAHEDAAEAEDVEDYDPEDEEQPLDPDVIEERKRARGEEKRKGGRVFTFLGNVWAELQRVQWPNRQQTTTLTGVVLGFVLIAGGYLGLLDAIFSKVVKQII